jgi:hypothetical protein
MSRNRIVGGFEDAFEKGQSTVKKTIVNTAGDFAKAAKSQIIGDSSGASKPQEQGADEVASANSQNQSQMSDEERVEFLSNLYGKSDDNKSGSSQNSSQKKAGDIKQALGIPQKDPNEGKTPEEIAKIESLRKQLHSDYYQEFLQKAKSKEEPVAERQEHDEQEKKMAELEEKEKNLTSSINPQVVRQGTGERAVNTIG